MVPRRYLKIYLTVSQSILLGFVINLLTTLTTWSMLVLVQTIAYIKLPMTEVDGILAIELFCSSVLGAWSLDIWKLLAKCLLTGLALPMLNLCKTWLMYSVWDTYKTPFFLHLVTYIPRIFLAGPKSFMSNYFDNYIFKFLILSIPKPAINTSST